MTQIYGNLWGKSLKLFIALGLFLILGLLFTNHTVYAANPTTINFQGKVANPDGTNVNSGTNSYTVVFRLYQNVNPATYNPNSTTCALDANCYWEETDTVSVTNGVFQVNLGATCAFTGACNSGHSGIDFNSQNALSLTMKFNGDANGYMAPLMAMQNVPYAANADKLNGVAASGFGQLATANSWTNTNSINANSITSLKVEQSGVKNNVLVVDTTNGTVGVDQAPAGSTYALQVTGKVNVSSGNSYFINGADINTASTLSNVAYLSAANAFTAANTFTISSASTALTATNNSTGAALVANNSSTGDSFDVQSGATNVVQVTNTSGKEGSVIFKNKTNNTTAFQVENSSGLTLLGVDTASSSANNLVTNPSFETATMWTAKVGSGGSATSQVSSAAYDGSNSMQIVTSGANATNAGASFATALTLNATYVMSMYVKASGTSFSTFEMGYTNTGGDNNCFTSDQTVTLSGWTRMSCSFTVTTTAGTAVYVKQTDTLGRTFLVDAVLLQTDANGTGNIQNGIITLQGEISTPVILQNTNNSSNAFVVQNANGSNIFGVDTTDTNLVANHGVEVNTVNWAGKSTGATPVIARDTSTSYQGYSSLKTVTGTTAQDGVKYTFPNNTTLLPSTSYELSFYAKISAGNLATLSYGRSDTGVSAGETSCVTTGALTTAWTRFSCSFTTGVTMGASGNPYIYISQGVGVSSITFWVDSVSLEPGSTLSPYGAGSLFINGVINSPVNFQNRTDSTTAFQIENAANSTTLLNADTANNRLTLGSGTGANATVIVAGNKTDTGDPATCTSGGIYYNSSSAPINIATNSFRVCKNGTWVNLVAGVDVQDYTSTTTWTRPYGTSVVEVVMCGGGGSGGGGRTGAIASIRGGGGGGGGGAHVERLFSATDTVTWGSTVNVTVGASSTGGAVNTVGNPGNQSSFGTFVTASGGGGGVAGAAGAAGSGGGGGGLVTVGQAGQAAAGSVGGEAPSGAAGVVGIGWSGAGGVNTAAGQAAQYGGGSGGGTSAAGAAGFNGGGSILGGGGGGAGGGTPAANTPLAGGAGGNFGIFTNGGGGAGGAAGTNVGTAGSGGNSTHCGSGGGGGGSNGAAGQVGGVGGAGGATTAGAGSPGGGGGGGGAGVTGAIGGAGARGEVWVFSW